MDNEQLKRLKKKRSSYKGQLTLFENYLLTLEDTTLSKRQVMELQLRITKLESILKEFDAVQLDIECICDDAQLEISERELVETKYYSLVTEARQMLNSTEDDGECDWLTICFSLSVRCPYEIKIKFNALIQRTEFHIEANTETMATRSAYHM
ncbi:hypothetical protein ACJJTC_015383 [Scirpophaga incertulas]